MSVANEQLKQILRAEGILPDDRDLVDSVNAELDSLLGHIVWQYQGLTMAHQREDYLESNEFAATVAQSAVKLYQLYGGRPLNALLRVYNRLPWKDGVRGCRSCTLESLLTNRVAALRKHKTKNKPDLLGAGTILTTLKEHWDTATGPQTGDRDDESEIEQKPFSVRGGGSNLNPTDDLPSSIGESTSTSLLPPLSTAAVTSRKTQAGPSAIPPGAPLYGDFARTNADDGDVGSVTGFNSSNKGTATTVAPVPAPMATFSLSSYLSFEDR